MDNFNLVEETATIKKLVTAAAAAQDQHIDEAAGRRLFCETIRMDDDQRRQVLDQMTKDHFATWNPKDRNLPYGGVTLNLEDGRTALYSIHHTYLEPDSCPPDQK